MGLQKHREMKREAGEGEVIQSMTKKESNSLIKQIFPGKVVSARSVGLGYGGNVFVVKLHGDEKERVVKFVANHKEPVIGKESTTERVYGSRWDNFSPSYELLRKRGLLIPRLFHVGLTKNGKFHFVIMEYLKHENVPRNNESVQILIARALSNLHQIKRRYQGWVHQKKPYRQAWKEAFMDSLKKHLHETQRHHLFEKTLQSTIQQFIHQKELILDEPRSFSFSHLDGFQGMMAKTAKGYAFAGFVDIEDYQFTDQRFALAGVELSYLMNNSHLLDVFWREYQKRVIIPQTYERLKGLFQVYYLLVWRCVFHDYWHGAASDRKKVIKKVTQLLGEIVSS